LFKNIIEFSNNLDETIYDGYPPDDSTSATIGIYRNIKGGFIEVKHKSAQHKHIISDLDPTKVVYDEKETTLETGVGDINIRNDKIIFYQDVHSIELKPLDSYPRVVIIPNAGSSIGKDKRMFKNRANLKITIDFKSNLIEEGEYIPLCKCSYHPKLDIAATHKSKSSHSSSQVMLAGKNNTDNIESHDVIDTNQSLFYTSLIGQLEVLTVNINIMNHHISEKGFYASLKLLDGRYLLFSFSRKQITEKLKSKKRIFDYGPAIPHIIIPEAGYAYRVTNDKRNSHLKQFGISPLLVIFNAQL